MFERRIGARLRTRSRPDDAARLPRAAESMPIPRGVRRLTVALALVAIAAVVAELASRGSPEHIPWVGVGSLVLLDTLGTYPILRFSYREQIESLDLFEAVLAPTIYALPSPLSVGVVAVAVAVSNVLRRNRPARAAFNVAQLSAAAGVATLVFDLAGGDGGVLDTATIASLLVAILAATIVNQLSVAYVLHLVEGQSIGRVLAGIGPGVVPAWLVGSTFNTAFGLVFVVLYRWSPAALVFAILPILALQQAYRAHASSISERARLAGLRSATRALASPDDPAQAIADFLRAVRACFQAEQVDLVLSGEGVRTVHLVTEDRTTSYTARADGGAGGGAVGGLVAALLDAGEAIRVGDGHGDRGLQALLAADGWRDCLAAPLRHGAGSAGVLAVFNRWGLEKDDDDDLALLEALASEAAGVVAEGALVRAVLDERRRFSDIVRYTSDAGIALDAAGVVTMWNPGIERISGYAAGEMIGRPLPEWLRIRDADGADVRLDAWARGGPLPADLQIVAGTGEIRWLACSYTRVPDPAGGAAMLIVVARDTTEARRADEMKEHYAGTVSHELRGPLTPIKGWAHTLLSRGEALTPSQRREAAESILRQTERLESIVSGLLDAARAGRGAAQEASVDVAAVAREAVADAHRSHPGRRILLEMPEAVGPCRGEAMWVGQILANLLGNAIKYSPEAEPVMVRIRVEARSVGIEVHDRGPGIRAADRERIFEPFGRLEGAGGPPGAGLGLYVSRRLAEAMNGRIEVRSRKGAGSTFRLRLSRATAAAAS